MPEQDPRFAWFRDARFGIFLTWGLYSVLGRNEWSLSLEPPGVMQHANNGLWLESKL